MSYEYTFADQLRLSFVKQGCQICQKQTDSSKQAILANTKTQSICI